MGKATAPSFTVQFTLRPLTVHTFTVHTFTMHAKPRGEKGRAPYLSS